MINYIQNLNPPQILALFIISICVFAYFKIEKMPHFTETDNDE